MVRYLKYREKSGTNNVWQLSTKMIRYMYV